MLIVCRIFFISVLSLIMFRILNISFFFQMLLTYFRHVIFVSYLCCVFNFVVIYRIVFYLLSNCYYVFSYFYYILIAYFILSFIIPIIYLDGPEAHIFLGSFLAQIQGHFQLKYRPISNSNADPFSAQNKPKWTRPSGPMACRPALLGLLLANAKSLAVMPPTNFFV